MTAIARAIPWAVAMVLIAVGKAYGLVAPASAQTMFVILPGLAVVTMNRQGSCRIFHWRHGGV